MREMRPESMKPLEKSLKHSKSIRDYLTTKWCNSRFGERYERDSKNLSKVFLCVRLLKNRLSERQLKNIVRLVMFMVIKSK